jgi:hypothetical protein
MRILFMVAVIMLASNLIIELLDSNMLEVLKQRKETIERLSTP